MASCQSANMKSVVSLNIRFSRMEYAGLGAGAPNSSVVIASTAVLFPARRNTSPANSAQLQDPSQVAWNKP